MKKRLKVGIIAALAAVTVVALVIGSRNDLRLKPRMAGGHSGAIAGLRAYMGAQGAFQRVDRYGKGKRVFANTVDGAGFPDLYRIGGPLDKPDGTEIKLIDLAVVRATSPERAKAGYWFVEITSDAVTGKPYDYAVDCGLCAVPAVYGKSGLYTYIINITGTVYKKDNGGKPVTVWPDVEKEGWVPVGR
ncbi:MAG: DUF2950 family protein [Planctomycetota bacterium]|jgi:hypothetical protein